MTRLEPNAKQSESHSYSVNELHFGGVIVCFVLLVCHSFDEHPGS